MRYLDTKYWNASLLADVKYLKVQHFFKPCLFIFILSSLAFSANAQMGGTSVFPLLNESPSARVTAMGGLFISVLDNDASLALQNPSLISPMMHNRLSLNYVDYLADLKEGYTGYVRSFDKIKTTFNGGIQFLNYGNFTMTDDVGNVTGTFDGSEYALTLGAGRTYAERFHYGVSATFLTSKLESYSATGAALTFAGAYNDSAKGFTTTVLFKNVGTQFESYIAGDNESLPFDIQAGISKRIEHTPFLFSLVLHDLYHWDMRYDDPNQTDQSTILIDSTQSTKQKSYVADNFFLHTIFGLEIYFGNAFRVNLAYNHQRRQELAIESRRGLAGFSFGADLTINRFTVSYGRAIYNVAGGVNQFSLAVNLDELFGKKM